MPELNLIIPCRNEAPNILPVLKEIDAYFRDHHSELNISGCRCIVIDDGSADETGQIVKNFKPLFISLELHSHEVNRGYGEAIRTGLNASQSNKPEYLMIMDGDSQYRIEEFAHLLSKMEKTGVDCVCGIRTRRADNPIRSLTAQIWTSVMYLSLGIKVKDLGCGQKLFRYRSLPENLHASGAFIWPEILHKIGLNGKISEVQVSHLPRKHGQSTGNNFSVIRLALCEWVAYMKEKNQI